MSYFLWIEDFENSPKITATEVLGGINIDEQQFANKKQQLKKNLEAQGIYIELSFQDGLGFIRQNLGKIDYIILDIDLAAYSQDDTINTDVLALLETFQDYQKPVDEKEEEQRLKEECAKLKALAGYYLYTELVVELGFPKQHILFCSNHGENSTSTRDAFKTAKIALPTIYEKSAPEVQAWVKTCYENPYSRLRRGIIEGCRHLKTLSEDKLRFKDFVKDPEKKPSLEDFHDYLDVLEQFLPLSIHENKDSTSLYKLFIRILAHEWEAAEPKQLNSQKELFAFSWIMKMTRNWLAHSKVFEQLTPQDVAYLFIVNMRAMFDLGDDLLPYEKHLLSLFTNVISADEMTNRIGDNPKKRNERNLTGRNIPLVENYALLLKATGNTWQAINYHDALNNLQKHKEKGSGSELLIKGLYQTFWFLTSSGGVYIPPNDDQIKDFAALNYQFKYFDYKKPEYLFEVARHIYTRSFS
ncbi:hypothetical protein [Methylicorpusculum sp.]|uniref:hypothetical protein n=1 Tax=Methylicorpusculum sp. TaxID=2713644 RepID=UPI00271E534E|nr:hypothetical protein [Methylicorpusculum sp.]MDO8843362.1 hypothetical protein [Methylicorpusculum sp.]